MSKRYYDGIFEASEDLTWERAPGKNVIVAAVQHFVGANAVPSAARVVDIGCGTGFLLNRLATEVSSRFELFGVDFSSAAITRGKRLYPHTKLLCGDGAKTGFESGTFDVLVSYGSYEHFEDPGGALKEAGRLLRSSGMFFMMMPTLGVDRVDRDDEGWYEERVLPGARIQQLQWNLRRTTWEAYFQAADLRLFETSVAGQFGALKPGVFFLGER